MQQKLTTSIHTDKYSLPIECYLGYKLKAILAIDLDLDFASRSSVGRYGSASRALRIPEQAKDEAFQSLFITCIFYGCIIIMCGAEYIGRVIDAWVRN